MRDEGGRGLDVRRSTEGARKKSGWFHPRKMRGLFTPPPSPRRPSLNRKIVTQPRVRNVTQVCSSGTACGCWKGHTTATKARRRPLLVQPGWRRFLSQASYQVD